jgi:hypothetical protein
LPHGSVPLEPVVARRRWPNSGSPVEGAPGVLTDMEEPVYRRSGGRCAVSAAKAGTAGTKRESLLGRIYAICRVLTGKNDVNR